MTLINHVPNTQGGITGSHVEIFNDALDVPVAIHEYLNSHNARKYGMIEEPCKVIVYNENAMN